MATGLLLETTALRCQAQTDTFISDISGNFSIFHVDLQALASKTRKKGKRETETERRIGAKRKRDREGQMDRERCRLRERCRQREM